MHNELKKKNAQLDDDSFLSNDANMKFKSIFGSIIMETNLIQFPIVAKTIVEWCYDDAMK